MTNEKESWDERIEREKTERDAKIAATTALIVRIGALLGMFPRENEGNEYGNNLVTLHSDTYGLHFAYTGSKPERLHINGTSWPTYTDRRGSVMIMSPRDARQETPVITVREDRGPEKIAQEIKTRLLPELKEVWDACKTHADATNATNNAMFANATAVAAALGEKVPDRRRNGYGDEVKVYATNATVVFCGNYTRFEISASDADHAVILARHIQAARAEYDASKTGAKKCI